jgi:hypothetical protein
VKGTLLSSPLSWLGYLYATLVGLIWGMPKWTFGRGGSCVGACYLTDHNVSDDVLEHEAVHKQQWKTYGMLFPLYYAASGRNPLKNRFEIEAGLEKGGYLPKKRG